MFQFASCTRFFKEVQIVCVRTCVACTHVCNIYALDFPLKDQKELFDLK